MGELDERSFSELGIQEQNWNSKLIAAIMLIIGLFAPIIMMINIYGWMMPEVIIQSIFWIFNPSYFAYTFFGFSFLPLFDTFSMFPFLLLRMVPVSQIYRYYKGKTTRKRAILASFIGDGFFLLSSIPYLILSLFTGLIMLVLPSQLIFCFLVLRRFPIPGPTIPWKSEEEPKPC